MGFNKRYITREGMLSAYKKDSIEGLHKYFRADALIGGLDCQDITRLYSKGEFNKIKEILDLELGSKRNELD